MHRHFLTDPESGFELIDRVGNTLCEFFGGHVGTVSFEHVDGAALDEFYSGPRTASKCAVNARDLYHSANNVGIGSEVIIHGRDTTGAEYGARFTPDGEVEPWQGVLLGACASAAG